MTTHLNNVTFLNAGYCVQLKYFVGHRSLRRTKFFAVFVYFEHPVHGPSLIDTGYSDHFFHATRRLPQRFYRWATPMRLSVHKDAVGVLNDAGFVASDVSQIFISHFHGDHVAGLRCFPDARFIHRSQSLADLSQLSATKQVHHAFLPQLLPDDFNDRGITIPEAAFDQKCDVVEGFNVHDYFGDQSLLLVDLPGHAIGHTGFLMQTDAGPVFYVVDATWDVDVLERGGSIPYLAKRFQHDMKSYEQTQSLLRTIGAAGVPILACHCPRTQSHVVKPEH